jgi:cystathionine beta-lyase
MKKSISTLLKHISSSKINRSANPPVVRASTILFDSMQELASHEKKILQNKPITHYTYGRYGSQTTIELQKIVKELEQAHHVFLHSTGFGSVSLAFMALCQAGDEVLVADNVYYPTREITEKLLPKYNITTKYYDPNNIKDLQNKITKKNKINFC